MIEGRPDWCVSRQRTWGVPLPLLLHKETNALHPQMTEIIKWVADKIQTQGVEVWYDFDLELRFCPDVQNYRPLQDILDVLVLIRA